MQFSRTWIAFAAAILAACSVHACGAELNSPPGLRRPAYLTPYDLCTPEDLFVARMLSPLVQGDDPSDWEVLDGIDDQLGDWVTQYIAANRIADTINSALPVKGQRAVDRVDRVVTEVREILHVEKPTVFIRSSAHPQCYVVEVGHRRFLILTSALLNLYEGEEQDAELRFIVGHELGHLKCNHLELRSAAYGILVAIQGINLAVVPGQRQVLLPTLAFGRLCSWMRESEISADRAGLLCCQDPQVAFNALSRLLSGLGASSTWIDPNAPDFNADALVQEYRQWESEPFVAFVQHVERFAAESPFIPERVYALKLWSESGDWETLLARQEASADEKCLIVIDAIAVSGLALKGQFVDPYVMAYDGYRSLLTTSAMNECDAAAWRSINVSCEHLDGKPIYFEIWDDNYVQDSFVAGFTVFPKRPSEGGQEVLLHESLVWNWKERTNTTRQGHAQSASPF